MLACGGHVTREVAKESSGDPSASARKGGAKATGTRVGDPDTEVGDCVEGPAEGTTADCAWVTAGRCYADRQLACNCACPHDRNSQCVSGFDKGPDGHVSVDCF